MSARNEEMEALQRELASTLGGMSLDEAQATLAAAQRMLSDVQSQHAQAQKDVQKARGEVAAASSPSSIPSGPSAASPPPAPVATKSSAKAKSKSTSKGVATMKSSMKITEEMKAAMKEAEALRAEMERARTECDDRLLDTKKALASLDSAQQEKERLGKKLAQDSDQMGKILEEEKARGAEEEGGAPVDPSEPEAPQQGNQLAASAASSYPVMEFVQKSEPKVALHVEEDGAVLSVQYTLEGGEWDEDDAIYLQCARAPYAFENDEDGADGGGGLGRRVLSGVYSPEEVQHGDDYEEFQYTVEPTAASRMDYRSGGLGTAKTEGPLIGEVSIPLPAYAGWYCVSYVRTIAELVGTGSAQTVRRERRALACQRAPDYCVARPVGKGDPRSPVRNESTGKVLRRRFAGEMALLAGPETLSVCWEDFRNISTMYATITPSVQTLGRGMELCRVQCWLRQRVDEGLTCVIEADITSSPGVSHSHKRTVYLEAQLLSHADVRDLWDKYATLRLFKASVAQNVDGSLSLRFRYDASTRNRQEERLLHGQQQPVTVTPTGAGAEAETGAGSGTGSSQAALAPLQCASCSAKLLGSCTDTQGQGQGQGQGQPIITQVSSLPTGVFDNMMHEFICAEEHAAGLNLCSNEVTTPRGSLLLGEVQVAASPRDVRGAALLIECKQVPSLLDLFVGFGGALATTPYVPPAGTGSGTGTGTVMMPPAVVSIDTCVLSCGRCLAYLGDALLKSTGEEEDWTEKEGQGQEELSMADVRDIRFSRAGVSMPRRLLDQTSTQASFSGAGAGARSGGGGRTSLAVESMVARALVHLNLTFSSQSFMLHVPTGQLDDPSGGEEEGGVPLSTVILMRISSSRYAVHPHPQQATATAAASSGSAVPFQEALCVRFAWGSLGDLAATAATAAATDDASKRTSVRATGREARVPLQYHDLVQLLSLLRARSVALGTRSVRAGPQDGAGARRFINSYLLRDCALQL
jgi:hypothetical protein